MLLAIQEQVKLGLDLIITSAKTEVLLKPLCLSAQTYEKIFSTQLFDQNKFKNKTYRILFRPNYLHNYLSHRTAISTKYSVGYRI